MDNASSKPSIILSTLETWDDWVQMLKMNSQQDGLWAYLNPNAKSYPKLIAPIKPGTDTLARAAPVFIPATPKNM